LSENQESLSGLRLIAHPLRLQILSLLTGQTMSAAEIARELDDTQANVSYHMRRLADGGLIRLVGERQIRGGVAKIYTHDAESGEVLNVSTRGELRQLLGILAHGMTSRGARYKEGSSHAFTDASVSVPASERERLEEATRALGQQIADAASLVSDGPRSKISATLMLFELE